MTTVDKIDAHLNELQEAVKQANAQRAEALEQEREQKLALITTYENEAVGFRNQAERATTDSDKMRLYGFAEHSDQLAIELKKELGIYDESEPVNDVESQQKVAKEKTLRKINSLIIKAILSLVAFFIADYTGGKLDAGFLAYCLTALSRIAYFVSSVYGGCWLVCIILFSFVPVYTINNLSDDFKGLKPFHRLIILSALGAALLHFINGFVPHAI